MIRVAVVDDQALVRAGFEMVLESAPDLEVVGSAANGAEAIDLVERTQPDVVLMDIRMPVMDGLEASRRILADERCADVRILILTTFDLDEYVYAALQAGASGFLLKDTPPNDLLAGVRLVAAGEALLSPGITRHLIEAFIQRPTETPPPDRSRLDILTDRERDVLALVAKGLSNTEIAGQLYISPATVKTHIARILTKLDARDRAQLIVIAYESRLVRPGET
ncbi:MAG TPA: response regulator transcription factor [Propionibacteriaceae bacterium]|jgi:DNA-binding NarL/FixJ family response regulator|nr:response regulator transcription factor [Propionibacteriaceae bacterium]